MGQSVEENPHFLPLGCHNLRELALLHRLAEKAEKHLRLLPEIGFPEQITT
jgi:hypothetical protein